MTSYARPRVRDIPNADGTRAAALSAIAADEARRYGATSVYDAKDILPGAAGSAQQQLKNRAYPNAVRAKRGSTARAQIVAEGLYLPGEAGNNATTPHAASLSLVDMDLRATLSMPNASAVSHGVVAKETGGSLINYRFEIRVGGLLRLLFWDGTGVRGAVSTLALPYATGDSCQVRVTHDNAAKIVRYWHRVDSSAAWTQLGADIATAATGSPVANAAVVEIGSYLLTTSPMGGLVKSVEIRSSINGTIVASPDFVAAIDGNTTLVDAQSNVWTVTATTGIDINDPVFLPHTGEHYVYHPNGSAVGCEVSTVLTADADAGFADVRWDIEPDTWTPSGNQGVSRGAHYLTLTTGGAVNITAHHFSGGSSFPGNVGVPITNAQARLQIRRTVNTVTGDSYVYERTNTSLPLSDDTGWTQVAFVNSASFQVALFSGRTWGFGRSDTGTPGNEFRGKMYGAYRKGTSTVFNDLNYARDIDTSTDKNAGQSTIQALVGGVATVLRPTTGLKTAVVTRPVMLLDGTNDYVQLPASDTPTFTATTGEYTVVALVRVGVPATAQGYVSAESAINNGLYLFNHTDARPRLSVGGASTVVSAFGSVGSTVANELAVVAGVVSDGVATAYQYGTGFGGPVSITGVGAITFAQPVVGRRSNGSQHLNGEVFACRTYKDQALTVTELDAISAELLAGAYA